MQKCEGLKITFDKGTAHEKTVLQDLSFELQEGDFVTVIGENGSGKSTLLNCLSGTYLTDSGKILLDNEDVTLLPEYKRARKIGRLFQDPLRGTAPHLTVAENLALAYLRAAGHFHPFSRISAKDRQFFAERLKALDMGLETRLDDKVGQLSGGQRQAMTLLMATLVPPKLLLLDEHTAALDPQAEEKVSDLTRKIVEEHHITCLMVTHDMQRALDTGNRTFMMAGGKIIFELNEEEKKTLSVQDLLVRFREASGRNLASDRILLG